MTAGSDPEDVDVSFTSGLYSDEGYIVANAPTHYIRTFHFNVHSNDSPIEEESTWAHTG